LLLTFDGLTRIANGLQDVQGGNELLPRMDANKFANERSLETEDDALPFDSGVLEVDEKGQMKVRGTEVIDALSPMTFGELLDAFDFY
jgi:hypothetical protein